MPELSRQSGYSLIELILVVVIVGILASMSLRSIRKATDTVRTEETKRELELLAHAIAGNPELLSAGGRSSYGYVGDVGALPPDLDALAANPGGYSTWNGPYIHDQLSAGGADAYFKVDAWGTAYAYAGSTTISSTGGPVAITRSLANSVDDLLYNKVSVVVFSLCGAPPGTGYQDSITVLLTFPDGAGDWSISSGSPDAGGRLDIDSIPIGLHDLRVVYLPDSDTLIRRINIDPGTAQYLEITLAEDYW
ncbi:MAG: type II secretion system protein [Candidatus Zixiibacteriota bacterium]|nr:MAG: type II secretion system protein [candidate division Zixibacteria bacterium]